MGLLLSILVACVGFVELLDFFYNVRRNLVPAENPGILHTACVRAIETVKERDVVDRIPKLDRILSHDDIEIEFNKNFLKNRSCSNLQTRYLVTEKEEKQKSRTPSPRRFVVSEEINSSVQRSHHQNSVAEFFFQENNTENSYASNKIIILKGKTETGGSSPIPLPLPKQFVVTEEVLSYLQTHIPNIKIGDCFCEELSQQAIIEKKPKELFINTENDEVRIFETSTAKVDQFLNAERLSPSRSRSPSPIPRKYAESFRRTPSPFPSFELMAPRNSICTELLDNSPVSVLEEDEDCYRSRSSSLENYIVEHTSDNTTEYRKNKLSTPERAESPKTKVVNALKVSHKNRIRSKSESESKVYDTSIGVVGKSSYHTQDLDSEEYIYNELDGVKIHKSRNNKWKPKNNSDSPSTSTKHSFEYDNEEKKKEFEPFWVNQ